MPYQKTKKGLKLKGKKISGPKSKTEQQKQIAAIETEGVGLGGQNVVRGAFITGNKKLKTEAKPHLKSVSKTRITADQSGASRVIPRIRTGNDGKK